MRRDEDFLNCPSSLASLCMRPGACLLCRLRLAHLDLYGIICRPFMLTIKSRCHVQGKV